MRRATRKFDRASLATHRRCSSRLFMSSSRALAAYANARLDDAPLCQLKLQLGVERWCCLLCRRQFRSARHIGRHLERRALHRDHLATARLHGRVSGALPATAAARGAPSSSPLVAAAPGPAGGGALPPEAPLEAAVAKPMRARWSRWSSSRSG